VVVKNSKINAECTWEIEWKRESVKELGDRETGEQGSTVAEIQEKQYANKRNIKLFRLWVKNISEEAQFDPKIFFRLHTSILYVVPNK
jgi:hypothetical protein